MAVYSQLSFTEKNNKKKNKSEEENHNKQKHVKMAIC